MDTNQLRAQFEKLAELTPKDPNCYVFIGENHGKFTGNTKHLFLYFARQRPDVECYYFTGHKDVHKMLAEANLPVVFFPDFNAVEILAKAKTVIVDSFDFKMDTYGSLINDDTRVIQLWHGVGFKQIGLVEMQSDIATKYNPLDLEYLYSGYDTVVSTSPFYSEEVFEKSFRADHFVDFGYSRNDALFRRPTKDTMLNCDTEAFQRIGSSRKTRKTILYAPTFRDNTGSPISEDLDIMRLHKFLDEAGLHMVIKAHRLTDINASSALPYLTFYENSCDVYPLMNMIDVMLTDYSSIYMDYLLLNRPVVFFCPDYDEYVTHNRQFQFPYEDMTPGPKCRTQDELHDALKLAAYGDDGFEPQRLALLDKAFLNKDGDSSQRIADYLCK